VSGHNTHSNEGGTGALLRVILVAIAGGTVVTGVAIMSILNPFGSGGGSAVETPITAVAQAAMEATEPVPLPPIVTAIPASPKWIWVDDSPSDDTEAFLRKTIDLPEDGVERAAVRFSCDNAAAVFVNGAEVGRTNNWEAAASFDVSPQIPAGADSVEIAFHATNQGGPAGLICVVELVTRSGEKRYVETDATWEAAREASFSGGGPAVVVGEHGDDPWGEIAGLLADDVDRQFAALPGFEVDLVYPVPRNQGSWVCITADSKGRLIASDQSHGLFRITPSTSGDYHDTIVEPIDSPVGSAQGLLAIENDLYVVVNGPRAQGSGLYRLRDTDGDDQYDSHELLRRFEGDGEHGPHAVIQGPNGLLYIVGGNHTKIPDPEKSLVPRAWDEDHLLPRLWDPSGHAVGIMAPGGWIVRTDRDGAEFEIVSIGFRNPYDIAFSEDGELFTYDADMEWDMGAPWYRPTRICHAVSGSDFGWRSGTGKWPAHYADSLPAMLDIGPGSPTGVAFGTGSYFPERYQRALFACDWTFGTIYAIHVDPDGATYRARREVFLHGRPLPIADVTINPVDGAMYMVLGGRGVASAIYRVRAADQSRDREGAVSDNLDDSANEDIELRRFLEQMHGSPADQVGLEMAWTALNHKDRFIRHAARVAIEHQSPDTIQRLLESHQSDVSPRQVILTCIALARIGRESFQPSVISNLESLRWDRLTRDDRLDLLRAWALAFIRGGEPDDESKRRIRAQFEGVYPTDEPLIDRELCDLLIYLESPVVVARTIPVMEEMDSGDPQFDNALLERNDSYGSVIQKMASNPPQGQQVHYALSLRNATTGWTLDLRERYFRWFDAARTTSGGVSFGGFLDRIREDALAQLPEDEREKYAHLGAPGDPMAAMLDLPQPQGPGRQWKAREILDLIGPGLRGRDYDNGRCMFQAARCADCHRFAGEGRMGGPDLTRVSTRYSLRDIVEAIIEPSKVVSDQYAQTEFVLDNDMVVIGIVAEETDQVIRVRTSLLTPEFLVDIDPGRIVSRRRSDVSAMLPNTLDRMNEDEVLDLIAYLLAEGDARSAAFGDQN